MRLVFLGVVAACAFAVSLPASAVDMARSSAFSVEGLAAPKADRDGDKIFDDLAARLERMEADDRLSVIVRLAGGLTSKRAASVERSVGGFELTRWLPIVDAFAATMTKAQVEALARLPVVAALEDNAVMRAFNDSAQASFGVTRARADVPSLDGNADGNVNTYSTNDLVVAVIDTGIDAAHPQLDDGKVLAFANCLNQLTPATCSTPAPFDNNDHGTHVSGTIAGDGEGDVRYKGIAPAAALVGVKVLGANGSGTTAGVISGIQWAVMRKATYGIEAINLSLGGGTCADGTDTESLAVNAAVAAGIVVLVAAGNSGPDPCTIGSPGAAADVITVGAMADTGVPLDFASRAWRPGFNLAAFSSRGPTSDFRVKPDVAAPGAHITSADANTSGYLTFNGTSMATPFVAGVALLMLDHNPSLTPAQIKSALMTTAIDWGRGGASHAPGSSGSDVDYGAGRLDAFAAIKAAGAPLGSAPAAPQHSLFTGSLADGATQEHAIVVTDTTFPLAATLIMPAWTAGDPDFDLNLFDPDNVLIGSSLSAERQDEVGAVVTKTGTYRLVVNSFDGAGDYILDVSGGSLATPPPPPPPPPPQPTPACPPSDVPSGATYRGTHSRGGTVCFTVTASFSGVTSFLVTEVPGDRCHFVWQQRKYPSPLPITSRTFRESDGSLTGAFPTDRGAEGTIIVVSDGFPSCSSGTVNWTAVTDATPPWVFVPPPPAPPPPLPPPPPPAPPPVLLPPPPPVRCVVPNVKGKTVPKAKAALRARRCAPGKIKQAFSGRVKKGRVVAQSKRPGTRHPRNTKVNLTVSKGAKK